VLLVGYVTLGAAWIVLRTTGRLHDHVQRLLRGLLPLFAILGVAAIGFAPVVQEGVGARWKAAPVLLALLGAGFVTMLGLAWRMLARKRERAPFVCVASAFLFGLIGLVAVVCVALATIAAREDVVPAISGSHWTATNTVAIWVYVALCAVALAVIWARAAFDDALYLWLAMVLMAAIVDLTLGNIAGGRYTIAWHISRTSFVVSSYLLLAFLIGDLAQRQRPSRLATVAAYGGAVAAVLAAVFLRWFLDPWLGTAVPYITLYGAVAISVWLGGWGPAVLGAMLGYAIVNVLYVAPVGTFALAEPRDALQLGLFAISCGLIIGLGEGMRRARNRHRAAEA